ncbi:hypothetical protein [Natrialba sp. SSL1]|uniref:hypothetical protein n=1 Tax=Natrialba sp. SSL1 TaxID=1869245 RepID=UPI0008F7FCF3|nr:hypothetical protein [Natrialba sp. SSL1]OIB58469.1 hypothetical protein BBD46_09115 [Natrialba sp. SSL1]
MGNGTNTGGEHRYGVVTDAQQRQFRERLGLPTTGVPTEPSLQTLRSAVSPGETDELAEMGQAVRADLSDSLDEETLETALSAMAERFDRFPELQRDPIPEYGDTPYQDLAEPAWRIEDHLTDTSFFASAESNLPSFTPAHIETTTEQLLQLESLPETLSLLGLARDEQLALVTNIVTSSEQLSWWEPTINYPDATDEGFEDGVDHEYVPPLHKRAMGGVCLWIDGLDWYIWQNKVMLTDEMIERGLWDVKAMLAGAYLLGDAARRVAAGTISDDDLTTLITASTATMILGQESLETDLVRVTDENRKPRRSTRSGDEPRNGTRRGNRNGGA